MNSPQEPVSPSTSTQSSADSPPPDDIFSEHTAATLAATSQQLNQPKRRLASGPTQHRDIKTRRRERGDSAKRTYLTDVASRETGRKEEFVDTELMERVKQEFGDPFDESDYRR